MDCLPTPAEEWPDHSAANLDPAPEDLSAYHAAVFAMRSSFVATMSAIQAVDDEAMLGFLDRVMEAAERTRTASMAAMREIRAQVQSIARSVRTWVRKRTHSQRLRSRRGWRRPSHVRRPATLSWLVNVSGGGGGPPPTNIHQHPHRGPPAGAHIFAPWTVS